MLNVGIIQMQSIPLEIDKNLECAGRLIKQICEKQAQLVVLPEFFSVGYSYAKEMLRMAEDRKNGKTVTWLTQQARENNIYILTSIYEVENGHLFNTMILAEPNNNIQYYRKRNPFWQECTLYQRGDSAGPGIFDTEIGRIGGIICFDAFTKETYDNLQLNQIDLVAIVSSWGIPRLDDRHPELKTAKEILEKFSYLATEVLPENYAISLHTPIIHVGQGGISQSPVPVPKYWPYKEIEQNYGDFWGHSHIRNAEGEKLTRAESGKSEFTAVASVHMKHASSRPEIKLAKHSPSYLSRGCYQIQPPSFMSKVMLEWCYRGFASEYSARRKNYLKSLADSHVY